MRMNLRTLHRVVSSGLLAAWLVTGNMAAAQRLPPEVMGQLAAPWPPQGWSEVLDLPGNSRAEPYRSEPRLGDGYFGQSLYRHIAGTDQYWTANVLIQDRGSRNAAWRAVSAVRCKSMNYHGMRARECSRGSPGYVTRTLHYETGRFYVTIQLVGPGETEYPQFSIR